MQAKQAAALRAVERIKDGMTVGLGSGTTAEYAIRQLGERVRTGLRVVAVATSEKTEALAKGQGISVIDPGQVTTIDITIDGADEVDAMGNLLKGGGGSLLREKIIAYASQQFIVIVDESKLVRTLGHRALPVEVTPFAVSFTERQLRRLKGDAEVRMDQGQPFITDNGNLILDCQLASIDDPATLDVRMKMIPGVIETGLFPHQVVTTVIIGTAGGQVREWEVTH